MNKILSASILSISLLLSSCGSAGVPAGESGWARGNIDSKIVLTEYSDFQCPACKAAEPSVAQIMQEFGDKIRVEYHHFPLPIHKNSEKAAIAAESAGMQKKFWEMHDALFAGQNDWAELDNPTDVYKKYAKDIGLDVAKFEKDMSSGEAIGRMNRDKAMANDLKLDRTPSFLLNGLLLRPSSFDELRTLIQTGIESSKSSSGTVLK